MSNEIVNNYKNQAEQAGREIIAKHRHSRDLFDRSIEEAKQHHNMMEKTFTKHRKVIKDLLDRSEEILSKHALKVKKNIELQLRGTPKREDDKPIDVKRMISEFENKVHAPIRTPNGVVSVKLSKLKSHLHKSFISGLKAVPLPTKSGIAYVDYQTVTNAVLKGEKLVRQKVDLKIQKLLINGKSLDTKINNMLNIMFKQLFSEYGKVKDKKAEKQARIDKMLRERAIAARNGNTNSTSTSVASVVDNSVSVFEGIRKYLFG